MPSRPCLEAGCGSLAAYRGRCAFHSKQRERQIGRAGRSIYGTKRWQMARRRVLSEEPMCRQCVSEQLQELATEVDHIDGNPYNNARDNLQPLCSMHHGRKTRREQLA